MEDLAAQIVSFILGVCTILLAAACGYLWAKVEWLQKQFGEITTANAVSKEAAKQFVDREELHEIRTDLATVKAAVEPLARSLPEMLRLMSQLMSLAQRHMAAA